MTPTAERVAVFHEIGRAISQWSYVEAALLRLVVQCVPSHPHALSAAYISIENFRSRLQFCDNLVAQRYDGTAHVEDWKRLRKKLDSLSSRRNRLVHAQIEAYPDEALGRRIALLQWKSHLFPKPPSPRRTGLSVRVPPTDALRLRDISSMHAEFLALTFALGNFCARLAGKPEPHAKSLEQASHPTTIRTTVRQIHEALGAPPRPSRKKAPD